MAKERTGEHQRGKNYCFVGFMSFVRLHFPPQMQSKVYELQMIVFGLPGKQETGGLPLCCTDKISHSTLHQRQYD